MKIRLEGPEGQKREAELTGVPVSVGRSGDNVVVLDDRPVSRRHCVFDLDPEGKVTLEDQGSRYGTTVNGAQAVGLVVVTPGDSIKMGDWEAGVFDETLPVAEEQTEPPMAETRKLGPEEKQTTRKTRLMKVQTTRRYSLGYLVFLFSLAALGLTLLVFALLDAFE